MEPNNNKKKIIIALCCAVAVILLTIPFLGKDNQTPKKISNQSNKKEIFNNFNESKSTNKVSKKKIVFVIIGIVVVIVLITLIILLIRRHNYQKVLKEACLNGKCYFTCISNVMKICCGINALPQQAEILFNQDIAIKSNIEFYKQFTESENDLLKNTLIGFYKLINAFFLEIDGHLLQVVYEQNLNDSSALDQMSQEFADDNKQNDEIFEVQKSIAEVELSEEEKKLLSEKKYNVLFKTLVPKEKATFAKESEDENTQQLSLFEHCHAAYKITREIHENLNNFFNTEQNEGHSNKYKAKIDNAWQEIENFFKIENPQEDNK